MTDVYSDVIQFRGTHEDFGRFQGEKLLTQPLMANRRKQWQPKKDRHFIIDSQAFTGYMQLMAPGIIAEISGLAEVLQLSWDEALLFFSGYYLEYGRSGCSVYADTDYLIRNYDSHPRSYEGRFVLYQPTDGGYAHMGPTMQVTGRIDGLNEKGLTVAYNFTHRKQGADGFLCQMIGRLILETCQNVAEAVQLLREVPHRHSFSYILLDSDGKSYVVEASPRQVVTRQSHVCTNHFHILDEENRYRQDESREREQTIIRAQQMTTDPKQAFRIMNQPDYDVFSYKYDAAAGTLHTVAYFPETLKAWFSLGPNRAPVVFDFASWLEGAKTRITRIKGTVEYPKGFVNEDYIVP